jgi:parvulin-like peptidyl-prolyl isomerase
MGAFVQNRDGLAVGDAPGASRDSGSFNRTEMRSWIGIKRMKGLRFTGLVGITLAVTLALSGCAGNKVDKNRLKVEGNPNETVATVGNKRITLKDFNSAYGEYAALLKVDQNPDAKTNPMIQDALKRITLNKLIVMTLVKEQADKLGVKVTDQDVETFKKQRLAQAGGPEMFRKLLEQQKITEEEFNHSVKEQLLIDGVVSKLYPDKVKVSDQEAEAYYKGHPTEFKVPETIHASHILVKAVAPEMKKALKEKNPKITDEALNKELEAMRAKLKAKADRLYELVKKEPNRFSDIAATESDDTMSAKPADKSVKPGDLGNLRQDVVLPEFWKAAAETKPGTLHPGVVETQFGYHIIAVHDHKQPYIKSFAEAKSDIVNQLAFERKQLALDEWLRTQMGQTIVKVEPKFQPSQPQPGAVPGGMGGAPGGQAPQGAPPPANGQPQAAVPPAAKAR